MILYIDTTDFNKVTFALGESHRKQSEGSQKKLQKKVYKIDPHNSHETLSKVDDFLKSVGVKSTSPTPPHVLGRAIKKICVDKGPGSYTGVRVGVTIAQALGLVWEAKVRAVSAADFYRLIT